MVGTVLSTKKAFLEEIKGGRIPPLPLEIPYGDPCGIYEALVRSGGSTRNSMLLESVKGPFKIARYSFILFDPYLLLRAKEGEVTIHSTAGDRHSVSYRPPLDRLRELVEAYPQRPSPELPPFQGGAAGLISYDFVRYIEDIPKKALDDLRIPDIHFMMADRVIAFDHKEKRSWIIVSPGARDTQLGYRDIGQIDFNRAYDEAREILRATERRIADQKAAEPAPSAPRPPSTLLRYEMTKERYMDIVRRAKEYIAAGDIFQANLSQRISSPIGGREPWEIYKALRDINPSPFAAYADFGEYQIVSSSPERLVKVTDGTIETRPIAGTRPRGKDGSEDEVMRSELLLHPKERAEHIMLIDLERNDIGRVSEYGSVTVDELMITEDYSHVIHIVSNVKGILQKGKTSFDVIRATFPGGTITGVPKVRCMEIIDELEPVVRGPYTGSLGYVGFSGNMDLNIIIRTFTIKDGIAYVQAGAGIVADSDPEKEYYETLKKAEALVRTLEALSGVSCRTHRREG
ncbi:MAG: anthranilate synthase component I family protein [Alphaproteobacteria bacterium]|uniref:Anthranilate synthase component I family protein n=1 Tax=Candidatus Nitrobium versatile TaxID=2884831 RepID=A0A953JBP6_9BACT|nr:anthranilate synthase component I family protein [Candidatus Nitrobium versatile]